MFLNNWVTRNYVNLKTETEPDGYRLLNKNAWSFFWDIIFSELVNSFENGKSTFIFCKNGHISINWRTSYIQKEWHKWCKKYHNNYLSGSGAFVHWFHKPTNWPLARVLNLLSKRWEKLEFRELEIPEWKTLKERIEQREIEENRKLCFESRFFSKMLVANFWWKRLFSLNKKNQCVKCLHSGENGGYSSGFYGYNMHNCSKQTPKCIQLQRKEECTIR